MNKEGFMLLSRIEIRLGNDWWDVFKAGDKQTAQSIDRAIEDVIELKVKK